jgi:hypothetical protein
MPIRRPRISIRRARIMANRWRPPFRFPCRFSPTKGDILPKRSNDIPRPDIDAPNQQILGIARRKTTRQSSLGGRQSTTATGREAPANQSPRPLGRVSWRTTTGRVLDQARPPNNLPPPLGGGWPKAGRGVDRARWSNTKAVDQAQPPNAPLRDTPPPLSYAVRFCRKHDNIAPKRSRMVGGKPPMRRVTPESPRPAQNLLCCL